MRSAMQFERMSDVSFGNLESELASDPCSRGGV